MTWSYSFGLWTVRRVDYVVSCGFGSMLKAPHYVLTRKLEGENGFIQV